MLIRSQITRVVSQLLRLRGERTNVNELRKRGVRTVRIVSREQLADLIEDAIEEAVSGLRQESADLKRAIQEAEQKAEKRFDMAGLDINSLAAVIAQCSHTSVGETQEIAKAVAGFVELERKRVREEASREQKEQIENLELRLQRLNTKLAETEHALHEMSAQVAQEGIASIFKTIAGIRATAQDYQRKTAILRDIFEKNVALRAAEISRN